MTFLSDTQVAIRCVRHFLLYRHGSLSLDALEKADGHQRGSQLIIVLLYWPDENVDTLSRRYV